MSFISWLFKKNHSEKNIENIENKGTIIKVFIFLFVFAFGAAACGQDVKIVELDPVSINFKKRTKSEKVEAKAMDIRSGEITGVIFKFRSEKPEVATVDSAGVVKPVGNGSTAIIARAPNGVEGETFVRVCLPKELKCEPELTLKLRVGTAAPIKCHVTDCNDEKISAKIEMVPESREMLLTEGDDVFIGLKEGDSLVTVKAFDMETKIKVHIDEQTFLPGMAPGSAPARKSGGKSKNDDDPYNSGGGRFDHILKNM